MFFSAIEKERFKPTREPVPRDAYLTKLELDDPIPG
jgi:hypothetical protein